MADECDVVDDGVIAYTETFFREADLMPSLVRQLSDSVNEAAAAANTGSINFRILITAFVLERPPGGRYRRFFVQVD